MVSCQHGGCGHRRHRGTTVFAALGLLFGVRHACFVPGPWASRITPRVLPRRCATSTSVPEQKGAVRQPQQQQGPGEKSGSSSEVLDDAVLEVAIAMAQEEEDKEVAVEANATQERQLEPAWEPYFIVQNIISALLVFTIVSSLGSSFIGITSGRVQDRSGGDFTLYDFFDNLIHFENFNLESWLGFNPLKLITGGSSTSSG